nr:MAG TPA: hypothetical protein [Microviridae sp.]
MKRYPQSLVGNKHFGVFVRFNYRKIHESTHLQFIIK